MAFRLHGLRPHLFAHGGQALRQDVLVAGFAPEEPYNEGRRSHLRQEVRIYIGIDRKKPQNKGATCSIARSR